MRLLHSRFTTNHSRLTFHDSPISPSPLMSDKKNPHAPDNTQDLPPPESYSEAQAFGGDTHQTADNDSNTLTTAQGVPIADNQNSLRYGARGPALMEDFHLREKLFHFDHER